MKTVINDISEMAHIWANKLQEHAHKSNGSMYFDGDTIYSYGRHFPIAKHAGNNTILFTERRYSVTTSKHISVVYNAASHYNIVECYNPLATHEENFKQWIDQGIDLATSLEKAKKPEKYLSLLGGILIRANKYAEFFNIDVPELLKEITSVSNKAEFSSFLDKKKRYEFAQKQKKEKELKARHKKELVRWMAGESHVLYVRDGYDYLRLNGDIIETTQGIKIPLAIGKAFYESLKADTLQVGQEIINFKIIQIDKLTVTIGCHNFTKKYLLQFGLKTFGS